MLCDISVLSVISIHSLQIAPCGAFQLLKTLDSLVGIVPHPFLLFSRIYYFKCSKQVGRLGRWRAGKAPSFACLQVFAASSGVTQVQESPGIKTHCGTLWKVHLFPLSKWV